MAVNMASALPSNPLTSLNSSINLVSSPSSIMSTNYSNYNISLTDNLYSLDLQSKSSYQKNINDATGSQIQSLDINRIESNSADYLPIRNFLDPNQYLVYLENREPFADVDGSTHIAHKVRDYIRDDKLWYDLILDTDADGDKINGIRPITVTADRILSERSLQDIQPREIYHFATTVSSTANPSDTTLEYPIEARSFVIKGNINRPLESTSRSALGSGIYGLYIKDSNDIQAFLTNPNQSVYRIECTNAYPVQDKEHGESITLASINTNRYMDKIIQVLRTNPFETSNSSNSLSSFEIAKEIIRINESPNLVTLWGIVFYRTYDAITKELLEDILARYAVDYLTTNTLVDSINGEILNELPINYIMRALGYDGIIASDMFNNGWNRGCVSYDYSIAEIIRGETARY